MARVRVLAAHVDGSAQPGRITYAAQIYEQENDIEPVWTCVHDHRTPVEAQLCGVEFITDRASARRHRGAA